MLRRLKNTTDKDPRGGHVLEVDVTQNPLTNPRQWTELPKSKYTGEVDKLQARGFRPEDQSVKSHIVIKPGDVVEFGPDAQYNEEQGEFVYRTYGAREGLPHETRVNNWIIEVKEDGETEERDLASLWEKYRRPKPQAL